MRLTDLQTFIVGNPWKNWVFLKLHTDAGICGVGEATLHRKARTMEAALAETRRYFLGLDPFAVERLIDEMLKVGRGPVHLTALSGVEIACYDIAGKALGTPVYNLLGGPYRRRIRAYANGWYTGPQTPDGFAQKAQEVAARGYTALKFDPFGSAHRTMSRLALRKAIDVVAAVREAVGEEVDLLIEGHGRFEPGFAAKVARLLEPFDPAWFEEPVPSDDVEGTAEVAGKTTIPIAGGERLTSRQAFADLIDRGRIGVVQPDLLHAGGLLETKKIAARAEVKGVAVAPHNAQGPVSTAVCAHFAACTPGVTIQEVFDDFGVDWARRIVDHYPEVREGHLEVPDRPGLGIDLNEAEMAKHPYDESHFLDLFGEGWEQRERAKPIKG
ncbi:MAG: hypothetical protein A3F84_08260 [Candidatus Handelsmanbacteria bacterium RIFCSPLOWO2_12_FULL_64_10]|uniref:Mandelate racemase/muconate lactonizing enzyme C-terminal domain-containing protein n=1 Tax=Handelsmanbacteria sp. (strain RIFCSPLOWO2_12_FULL_64_10) TaxID=1817868 RepID=A0A1F6D1M8_HANXR|nr:MAG: hypothetical protein A3F84_08260 [Candidatus Handelsmanbacteria bacterium RIFCSPLOWO2_12_FULL_64_10]